MPKPPAEPESTSTSATLRELAWTIHRHAPERAGVGPIPTTEIAVLKVVVDAPGSTVGDIVTALGLRQPNVSAALRVLGQRGLVEREKDAADGRISRVRPTSLGLEEHRAISDAWAHPVEQAIAALDDEQRRAIAAAGGALRALDTALRQATPGT